MLKTVLIQFFYRIALRYVVIQEDFEIKSWDDFEYITCIRYITIHSAKMTFVIN